MTPDSLVGRWCALGPSDHAFDPDDCAFAIHRIVDDHHDVAGCVTVENSVGQRFPLSRGFAEKIATDEDPRAVAARETRRR